MAESGHSTCMTAPGRSESLDESSNGAPRRLALEVPADAGSIGAARHAVTAFLSGHDVPIQIREDIELATSELVTNAVVHPVPTEHHVRVGVEIGTEVVLTVANHGPVTAIPPVDQWRPASPTVTTGRGLGIVRQVTDEAEVRQDGPWTVVSCARLLPDGRGDR